ncbi:MAG TPA: MFS transporter [Candidatus Binataceae bacterium]|nr:MFS transporter [Candidatus Binataceae bacterium]
MPILEASKQAPLASQPAASARLILFITVFIDLLGFGIVIPLLPMFASRLGISFFGIGAIMAIYSLAQFIFAPILGRISDRIGRRPVIMLGLLGSSVGYLIYGFAGSFVGLFLSRAVHGACAATISTAQAYIADTTDESNRARGMGMIGAAFGLGFVIGPAIGGLLGSYSLRMPGFFAAALTFANLLFATFKLPESHQPEPGARIDAAVFLAPIRDLPMQLFGHHLSRLFAVAFMTTFALAAFETTFALMIPHVYGYGPTGIGALLAFAGLMQALAQGYLLGKIVKRVGELRLLSAGIIIFAIGLAPMANLPTPSTLLLALAMLSIGYGFASPTIASLISKLTQRVLQGEALGINQSASSMARIFGPLAGGLAYGTLGASAPYVGGAVVALMAFILTRGIEDGAA